MAKLKEKILRSLQNNGQLEITLNEVSQSQENLLKNHSNPAFSSKNKNKILKEYTDLQDIGKSLYRYNTLQEYNYINEAQEEKEDIENKVLKTGITYNKYVWRSENSEHTCDKCKELDGQVFDFYDEVPERPHPNCKCTVEIVEDLDNETEDSDNTNKIPPQNPNPQSEQESTSQNPTHQNPSQAKIQDWIKPCNGPITSGYGKRVAPVPGASSYHNGWDIGVPIGTPVSTIADGKVIAVGPARGYGNWVVIDHGIINGTRVTSEYGHISSWNVSYGQVVKQGQVIAKSGNTGYSSGPHLHITIREGNFQGTAVNPSKYIKINF